MPIFDFLLRKKKRYFSIFSNFFKKYNLKFLCVYTTEGLPIFNFGIDEKESIRKFNAIRDRLQSILCLNISEFDGYLCIEDETSKFIIILDRGIIIFFPKPINIDYRFILNEIFTEMR